VILHGDQVERLCATATVLGLFDDWQCEVEETCVRPNDILAICTDGVLEATNAAGEELGGRPSGCAPRRTSTNGRRAAGVGNSYREEVRARRASG
jgi:hypothetical protein